MHPRRMEAPCLKPYLLHVLQEGFGWFGNLQSIMPGEGYKMKLNTAGDAAFPAA